MGHGIHDHPGMKVKDASEYKLEECPPLLKVQADLAKHGLKDPWLRNRIWVHDPKYGTMMQRALTTIFRGWKVGLAAFLVTIAVEKALGIDYHPHHEEHSEEEHHH